LIRHRFSRRYRYRVWKTKRGNNILCNGRARNLYMHLS